MTALPVDHFVPHRGAMSLLDRVIDTGADNAVAEVNVRPGGVFGEAGGVPAWVGIEYMAQAIAAWAGGRARRAGRDPAIGFLLGSRRYTAHRPLFTHGQRLRVQARCELIGDNGLGQFACHIHDAASGALLAEAMVSVFEPPAGTTTTHEGDPR